MRRTSRSAQETFRRCRRKYFYQYAYQGTGVTSPLVYEAMTLGSALHEAMPSLLRCDGKRDSVRASIAIALSYWKDATANGFGDKPETDWPLVRREGAALIEGLLLAWNRARRVRFLEEYRLLYTEEEMELVLSPGLVFDSRSDLIVEDIIGQAWVIDWKSVGRSYDWGNRFHREPQSFTQPYVAEKILNREIKGTIYEGLWKGNSSGSILIRGVRNTSDGTYSGYAADAKKSNHERFDAWEHDFPLQGDMTPLEYWVAWLPEEVVRDQFLTPQAIPFNRAIGEEWMNVTTNNETAVALNLEEADAEETLTYFYKSESDWNCQGCQFESLCWNDHDIIKLMKDGKLVPRKDHHKRKPDA